jgi:thiamine-phosphate pyrophosphorylase
MKKYISRFHYLTQDLPNRSHVAQAQTACEVGVNWIQYRCLSKTDEEMLPEIHQIAAICDDWGATLILTNHFHLLNQVDAQGVHIEDLEADFLAIKNSIGEDKTLGGSATNIHQLKNLQQQGVDYAGFGPFAATQTKPNTYPLLGLEGYRELKNHPEINLPVIAVGGIPLENVANLLATGIYGIAVSAAVNSAENPGAVLKEFYRQIY